MNFLHKDSNHRGASYKFTTFLKLSYLKSKNAYSKPSSSSSPASLPCCNCHCTLSCSLKVNLSRICSSPLSAVWVNGVVFFLQNIFTYPLSPRIPPSLSPFVYIPFSSLFSICLYLCKRLSTVVCHLITETLSEKCVPLGDCIIVATSLSALTQTWMVPPVVHLALWCSLWLLGCKPVQHVTVLNTIGSHSTIQNISKHRTGTVEVQHKR